jgi:hypothetical protein
MRNIFRLLVALVVLTGCYAHVRAEPVYVEVDSMPPDYAAYPHTVYLGQPVYYVHGRWYYRHGPRWAYYRSEPRDLVEYRRRPTVVVRESRAEGPRENERERRGGERVVVREQRRGGRNEAPPARRVRRVEAPPAR